MAQTPSTEAPVTTVAFWLFNLLALVWSRDHRAWLAVPAGTLSLFAWAAVVMGSLEPVLFAVMMIGIGAIIATMGGER